MQLHGKKILVVYSNVYTIEDVMYLKYENNSEMAKLGKAV